jgi:hypothetical protein
MPTSKPTCRRCGEANVVCESVKDLTGNQVRWMNRVICKTCGATGYHEDPEVALQLFQQQGEGLVKYLSPESPPCSCCAGRRVIRANNYTSTNRPQDESWITLSCPDCQAVGTGFTLDGAWKSMKQPDAQQLVRPLVTFIPTIPATPPWMPPARPDQDLESKWRAAMASVAKYRELGSEYLGIEPYFSLGVGKEIPTPEKPVKVKVKVKLSDEVLIPVVPFVLDPDDDEGEDDT